MSFADERRASGKAMTDSRRASGKAMVESRRSSGREMVDSRRASGKALRDDMRALAESDKPLRKLSPVPARGGMTLLRGRSDWVAPPKSTGGGGIASPLTETDFALREYYTTGTRSSDGLFFIPAVKTIVMYDANEEEVKFQFAQQAPPEVTP